MEAAGKKDDSGDGDDETWRDMPAKGRRYLDDGRAERALDRLLLYRVYTMRCQLVQTEGATLAESRRAHAAFGSTVRVVREGLGFVIRRRVDRGREVA